MPDLITFITALIVTTTFVITTITYKAKYEKSIKILIQTELEKIIYIEKLSEEINKKESLSVEKTDGFLKFISESRDWAYEYIEDVQKTLDNFDKNINEIKNLKLPPKETLKKILDAYQAVQSLMPQDDIKEK